MTDKESGRIVARQGRPVLAIEPQADEGGPDRHRLRGSGR
jgi:hypothetical protein